jgi:hypothetical protein
MLRTRLRLSIGSRDRLFVGTRASMHVHQGSACRQLKGVATRCEFCLRKKLPAGDVYGAYQSRSRQIQVYGRSHSSKGWSRWLDRMRKDSCSPEQIGE